jgi:hypothetical protein
MSVKNGEQSFEQKDQPMEVGLHQQVKKELLTQVKPRQLMPSASMSPRREG